MKTLLSLIMVSCIVLAETDRPNLDTSEQIAFDYFVSEIIKEDFKGLSAIEFKGKLENTYSSLGNYKFCLTPDRLGPMIKSVTKGKTQTKPVSYNSTDAVSIKGFTDDPNAAKLYLYRSVHVADNFYVFLSVKLPKEPEVIYIFEITPEGKISRSCKAS